MNTLHFITPGRLDTRAITVFGLSAKEGENPIGYFGTGLKYAIAVLVREGAEITINTDGDVFSFSKNEDVFRNKTYHSISMSSSLKDYELPFTTELGKNWVMWQVFRELHCNTLDEGGVTRESGGSYVLPNWDIKTIITVRHKDFYDAYMNRSKYFIDKNRMPITIDQMMDVYPGESEYQFYRGIRVGELHYKSMYTWNYKYSMELTEDRTAKYSFVWEGPIPVIICHTSSDKEFIHNCVTAPDDTMESRITFGSTAPVSSAFMEVMEPLAHDFSGLVNVSARQLYEYHARKKIGERDSIPLTKIEQTMLNRSKQVCRDLGTAPDDVPIIVCKSLGANVLGLSANNCVFLSKQVFDQGTKMVAGTLYEELLHHETRMVDMTRTLQNFLINKLMTLYEETKGEPL